MSGGAICVLLVLLCPPPQATSSAMRQSKAGIKAKGNGLLLRTGNLSSGFCPVGTEKMVMSGFVPAGTDW
ncbi:hypothetical protein KTAU_20020 [Thermogemmatispora aurantia]|uniref:Secreted protein n=1 Tax=Thermogemmatispora aurantia TaxID=2045279 RepID=A0A5J4K756_9CHLR|nr:hypothetical protein KTAU_20020 [Thermogemmatispora aurantia]